MSFSFSRPDATFRPQDGLNLDDALARVTHLAVGAHPDDLEFMSGHGILACHGHAKRGFVGVTVAAGSDEAAVRIERRREQQEAARLGGYLALGTLEHASPELKAGRRRPLVDDLKQIFARVKPEIVYTHNPADKHDTHVAVCLSVIEALRETAAEHRPRLLYGCEVWRGLDWIPDSQKVLLDVSAGEKLLRELMAVYKSQLKTKAYDEAVIGRKRANATFLDANTSDSMKLCEYALDMTSLLVGSRTPAAFVEELAGQLAQDMRERINRL